MYCSNCGKENQEHHKFCKYCGKRIEKVANSTEHESNRNSESADLKPTNDKKRSGLPTIVKILIIIFIGIPILGIISAAVLVAINPAKRTNQAEDAQIKNDIGMIATKLVAYHTAPSNGEFPPSLNSLISNNFTSIPVSPDGSPYQYKKSGGEVVVFLPMNDPQTPGNVWCWRSAEGTSAEMPESSCRP